MSGRAVNWLVGPYSPTALENAGLHLDEVFPELCGAVSSNPVTTAAALDAIGFEVTWRLLPSSEAQTVAAPPAGTSVVYVGHPNAIWDTDTNGGGVGRFTRAMPQKLNIGVAAETPTADGPPLFRQC